ncbi:MAG: hypothetical protein ACYCP0_03335 [Acidiferrobacteraceae bacterium]
MPTVTPEVERSNGERAPVSPKAAAASEIQRYLGAAVRATEEFARYLGNNKFSTMRRDTERRIKERPVTAVLIGMGLGILIGRLLRSD